MSERASSVISIPDLIVVGATVVDAIVNLERVAEQGDRDAIGAAVATASATLHACAGRVAELTDAGPIEVYKVNLGSADSDSGNWH